MVKANPADKLAHDYPAGRFKRAPLNAGNVDHRSLFRALTQMGYDRYLSCEASGGEDPIAVAKYEYTEMQKLLKVHIIGSRLNMRLTPCHSSPQTRTLAVQD